MSVQLGYACVNQELQRAGITTNRSLKLATFAKRGVDYAKQLALQNFTDLLAMLEWNEKHGFRFFRMGSDMISHYKNPQLSKSVSEEYHIRDSVFVNLLQSVGKYAREHGHRLTFHPSQFLILSSPDRRIVDNSIRELEIHAELLQMMGLGSHTGSVIIFHGGGTYGNKTESLGRLRANLRSLPNCLRDLCALENDERSYSVMDLLPICEELGIPLLLDVFHYLVMHGKSAYRLMLKDDRLWDRISQTWRCRGIKMKIHVSSQRPDARVGAHADYIDTNEVKFKAVLAQCKKYDADIMVEAKQKELAMKRLLRGYFTKSSNGRVEWRAK